MSITPYIEKRSRGIRSQQIAWESAWEACRVAGMGEEEFLALADLVLGPTEMAFLGASLKGGLKGKGEPYESGQSYDALITFVDRSSYALDQWGRSLSRLINCLREAGARASFMQLLGYVGCCAEFASGESVNLQLADVVEEMYRKHGLFE